MRDGTLDAKAFENTATTQAAGEELEVTPISARGLRVAPIPVETLEPDMTRRARSSRE